MMMMIYLTISNWQKLLFVWTSFIWMTVLTSEPINNVREDGACVKQCICAMEYLSEMPMMKWLTIPMSEDQNPLSSANDNNVIYEDDDCANTPQDKRVNLVSCVQQDQLSYIRYEEFVKPPQALNILYGVDMSNETIKDDFADFKELLALNIQGYKDKDPVHVHVEAFRTLYQLQYLNIERVQLFATVAVPNQRQQMTMHVSSSDESGLNGGPIITFKVPDEPDIVSYEEYKTRRRTSKTTIFSQLENLHFLRLFRCHIDTISWQLFDGLFNLHILSLRGNNIVELPAYVFYSVPELRSLDLSDNQITRIRNESLAGLFKLEAVDLSGNQLTYLSDLTFAPLPNLYKINMLQNPLQRISESTFEVLNNTVQLWIGSTVQLSLDKSALNGMSQLERLQLLGIHVSILDKNLLAGLASLTHLRTMGYVKHLNFDAFVESPLLQELVMRHCSLKSISVDAFYGLANLVRLDLSHNRLHALPPRVFDQLPALQELMLTRNKFVTLSPLALANLQHVQMIRLDGNTWKCSCDMVDWSWLRLNRVKERRLVDLPCTYHYDKVPCTWNVTEIFVPYAKVAPKCSTPREYEGLSAVHVVTHKLNCRAQRPRKYPKKGRTVRQELKRIVVQQVTQSDDVEVTTKRVDVTSDTPHNTRPSEIDEIDNNLGDLSHFLSQYQNVLPNQKHYSEW